MSNSLRSKLCVFGGATGLLMMLKKRSWSSPIRLQKRRIWSRPSAIVIADTNFFSSLLSPLYLSDMSHQGSLRRLHPGTSLGKKLADFRGRKLVKPPKPSRHEAGKMGWLHNNVFFKKRPSLLKNVPLYLTFKCNTSTAFIIYQDGLACTGRRHAINVVSGSIILTYREKKSCGCLERVIGSSL